MAPSLSNKRLGKFVQQLKRKNGEAIRTQRAGKLYNARYRWHRSRFWALVKNYILHLQHFSSSRFAHFCTASNSKFQQTFAIFFQEFWKHLEYLNRIRRFPDRFRLFLGIQKLGGSTDRKKHRELRAENCCSSTASCRSPRSLSHFLRSARLSAFDAFIRISDLKNYGHYWLKLPCHCSLSWETPAFSDCVSKTSCSPSRIQEKKQNVPHLLD